MGRVRHSRLSALSVFPEVPSMSVFSPSSPASRFSLKNSRGSLITHPHSTSGTAQVAAAAATMNSGGAVTANRRERCCFCFDLRYGVVTIAFLFIFAYCISIGNMVSRTLAWEVKTKPWQNFEIFSVAVGLPLNIAGLYGAFKEKQKFVYAYFLFSAVYTSMSVIASIAFLVQIGRGQVSKQFIEHCMNVPGQTYETCKATSKVTVGVTGTFKFFISLVQIYWTYVVRRLYLQILIKNAGNFSSYVQV